MKISYLLISLFISASLFVACTKKVETTNISTNETVSTSNSTTGTQQVSAISNSPSPQDKTGYFVIGFGSRNQEEAAQESQRRNREGWQTHVSYSSGWTNFTRGWYIVVYGIYDSKEGANAVVKNLKSRGINVYAKFSGYRNSSNATENSSIAKKSNVTAGDADVLADESGYEGLDAEAYAEARKYWRERISKCGDSFYAKDNIFANEYKDFTFNVEPTRISRADTLNGIEWKGGTRGRAATSRTYSPQQTLHYNTGWNRWSNGLPGGSSLFANVKKEKGQWTVTPGFASGGNLKAIKCSEVPK